MLQLQSLLKATASGSAHIEAYEMSLVRKDQPTRSLLLNATRLDDGDENRTRLLLAISDVTLARAESHQKDELIREKAILLREVQHRVANSLQIIASVLMQSARMVQSVEAKGHLQDAHHRVMSIAALQKHLSITPIGDVPLKSYLKQLCESIGSSMIYDQRQMYIVTDVDESVVNANTSVTIGLIVTELVINALKHGYPEHRQGTIHVGYMATGSRWSLTVQDDGVGLPAGEKPKAGLGTGIIEALARQMGATIDITDSKPGVCVNIYGDNEGSVSPLLHDS